VPVLIALVVGGWLGLLPDDLTRLLAGLAR
jgi:hypothetical protein